MIIPPEGVKVIPSGCLKIPGSILYTFLKLPFTSVTTSNLLTADIIYNNPFLGLMDAAEGLNRIFSSPIAAAISLTFIVKVESPYLPIEGSKEKVVSDFFLSDSQSLQIRISLFLVES